MPSISANAYSSPISHEMLIEHAKLIKQRIAMTQHSVKSIEEKIQKNISPELTEIFNKGAKTLIDLYA